MSAVIQITLDAILAHFRLIAFEHYECNASVLPIKRDEIAEAFSVPNGFGNGGRLVLMVADNDRLTYVQEGGTLKIDVITTR